MPVRQFIHLFFIPLCQLQFSQTNLPVSQVSILVSKPVLRLGGDLEDIDGEEVVVEGEENFTRLQVATAVTLGVGIIQVNYNCTSIIDLEVTDFYVCINLEVIDSYY